MKLYSYWRSSASYRVRIALHLKGLAFDYEPVHLMRGDGDQHDPNYVKLNRQQLVPTLTDGDLVLGQSLAIIEYLEERYPDPPLLPRDTASRARARQIALAIAADIHPIDNLRVMQYLENVLHLDRDARRKWYDHWIRSGLDAVENLVDPVGPFALPGEAPSYADIAIVPQLANAKRTKMAFDAWPNLMRIDAACAGIEAFDRAKPERQPDAER